MIVPSMLYKEIYDHLLSDIHRVKFRTEYLLPKAIKEFKKAKKLPAWRWYEYTVPSTNNSYIIYFYVDSRLNIEKPVIGHYSILFKENKRFVVKAAASLYRHTEESALKLIRQIHVYSSHFLERYNERILKNKSLCANDVACIYLSRNNIGGMPILMNESINKRIEKYEGARYGYRVRDGFCFAKNQVEGILSEDGDCRKDKVDTMLILYKTFMNESDMKDTQLAAIDEGHYLAYQQAVQCLMKESKDGFITLQLEP